MVSVSAENLVVARSGYPAIANGTFELPDHHFALVTGANGSGKTTLLKAIAGTMSPERGDISITNGEQTITSDHPRMLRRIVSYVGHSALYMRHIKVLEHLELCEKLDLGEKQHFALSPADALNRFHLESKSDVRVENLSAGQQRRLHLASSFVRSTPLMCIDEPHASLDDVSKSLIDAILLEQYTAGRTVIVATHDPERLSDRATHEIEITNGVCTVAAKGNV